MKNFGKLAVLGVVLAVSGRLASAATINPFTGFIIVQDAPTGDIGSSDSTLFVLSNVFSGTSATGVPEPNVPSGAPNLSSFFVTPMLFTFSTAAIASSGTTGVELFSGVNSTNTETASFFATSYNALAQNVNGDYSLTAYGYFTDRAGDRESGYDNINFNSGVTNSTANTTSGSLSEILTALPSTTPEPSSLMLLGTGLIGGAGMLGRRLRRA
jgi:hypothetical protein